MSIMTTIDQVFNLGRRIAGNLLEIGMSLLKEASSYSKPLGTLYTFLSGIVPSEADHCDQGASWQAPSAWSSPPPLVPGAPTPVAAPVGEAVEEAQPTPDSPAASGGPTTEMAAEASDPAPATEEDSESASGAALDEAGLLELTKKDLQDRCDQAGLSYRPKDTKAALVDKLLAE